MATPAKRLLKQLLLAVATATLLSIVCDAAPAPAAAGRDRAAEIHASLAHKNIADVYANHVGRKQQPQPTQPTQQQYYNFHLKRNNTSGSNTKAADSAAAATAAGKNTRRSYNGYSASGGGSGNAEWRITYNGGSGSSSGSGGNSGSNSYNFGPAKLNDITNLSGLQHISGGFGGGSATTAGAKQHTPIYEEQQENDYGTSGAAGQTSGQSNQHGVFSNGWGSASSKSYSSGSSAGSDVLSTAPYNFHAAGTHTDFLPSFGGKYSSAAASTAYSAPPQYHQEQLQQQMQQQLHQQLQQQQQSSDKISNGNFMHHYEHNSGGYGELSTAAAFAQQHPQLPTPAAMHYFPTHDAHPSAHSGPDAAASSASSSDIDISFDHHDGGSDGGDGGHGGHDEGGATGPSYDESGVNYSPEQHHSEHEGSPHHVVNYIPYPVVKKVHFPVHEPVKIPISHAVIIPVHKPVPIHIPVPKAKAVPVEKELRVAVERVVPFPVEKPVPVPVEKRVPFNVYKYVTVKVPHPFPVKVPVFKTILHKVKSKSW